LREGAVFAERPDISFSVNILALWSLTAANNSSHTSQTKQTPRHTRAAHMPN
jgi:hypothetical protein